MGHGKDLDYCLAKSRKMCSTREGAEKALKRHFKKSPYCASNHDTGWGGRYQNYGSVARYNKRGKCLEYFFTSSKAAAHSLLAEREDGKMATVNSMLRKLRLAKNKLAKVDKALWPVRDAQNRLEKESYTLRSQMRELEHDIMTEHVGDIVVALRTLSGWKMDKGGHICSASVSGKDAPDILRILSGGCVQFPPDANGRAANIGIRKLVTVSWNTFGSPVTKKRTKGAQKYCGGYTKWYVAVEVVAVDDSDAVLAMLTELKLLKIRRLLQTAVKQRLKKEIAEAQKRLNETK